MYARRMHGAFAWNELATANPLAARKFYYETLGWTFEEHALPDGKYWVAKAGDKMVGGLGGLDTAAVPGTRAAQWFAFVAVDDVDARVAKAVEHGGSVVQAPHDVAGVGRVAVIRDPAGAVLGLLGGLEHRTDR